MKAHFHRLLILFMVFSLMLSFSVTLPLKAQAEEVEISKILTTLSSTPVALMDPSVITVATSTPGCRILSAGWLDSSGSAVSGAFGLETYTLVISIGVMDGYTIRQDVACYLNNSAISCAVDASGDTVTLSRDYTAAAWAPTVYKNPGNETVDEGGWASFVVSGDYVRDYEWALVEPQDRGVIPVDRLKDSYSMMEVTGNNSPKLILYHIPYELNGWKVVCDFIGAGEGNVTRSKPAILTVNPTFSRPAAASVQEQAAASPSPAPAAATSAPASSSAPEPAAAQPQEHSYSDTWSYDARGHWRNALDGSAPTDEALHSFVWTELEPETADSAKVEQGVCDVCGFTISRRTGGPAPSASETGGNDSSASEASDTEKTGFSLSSLSEGNLEGLKPPSVLMALLLGLIPLDLIMIIVHLCGPAKQRRRKGRRR